jgi:acyl carrier protein
MKPSAVNDDSVLNTVRAIVQRIAGPARTPPDVGPDTRLGEGFWLDSVEMLEVILACEEQFGLTFEESRDITPETMRTLGTLAATVRSRLAALGR